MDSVHCAQLTPRSGPSGKTMASPFTSASMLGPSAEAGKLKLKDGPKIAGYDSRTISFSEGCTTSASTRYVTVSDQLRTSTVSCLPSDDKVLCSIRVKGHGPAMQDTRTL